MKNGKRLLLLGIGFLFLLLGVIASQLDIIQEFCKSKTNIMATFFVPAAIDLFKCLGTSIIVAGIILSKDENEFQNLTFGKKKDLVKKIVTPKKEINNIYTNLSRYEDKNCESLLNMYSTNFRTNYDVNAKAYIENGKIKLDVTVKYREYKVSGSFQFFYTGFESRNDKGNSIIVSVNGHTWQPKKTNNYIKGTASLPSTCTMSFDDSLELIQEFIYDRKIDKANYIDLTRSYIEYGTEQSKLFSLRQTKPCEGIYIRLEYTDDITVVPTNIINYGDLKSFNIQQSTNQINISSTSWMQPGFGIAILLEKKQN